MEHCHHCYKQLCPDCIATSRTYLPEGGLVYFYCEDCKDDAGGEALFVCSKCSWVGRCEDAREGPVPDVCGDPRDLFCPECASLVTPAKPLE
jgi:hypothetical protein